MMRPIDATAIAAAIQPIADGITDPPVVERRIAMLASLEVGSTNQRPFELVTGHGSNEGSPRRGLRLLGLREASRSPRPFAQLPFRSPRAPRLLARVLR
jgi:hypothetical protein